MFNNKLSTIPTKTAISNRHMIILGFVSSLSVVQFAGVTVFLVLLYSYLLIEIIRAKAYVNLASLFLPYLLAASCSTLMPFFLGLSNGFISNNIKGIINLYAVFMLASTVIQSMDASEKVINFLVGLRWSCRIQVLWIVLQFASWNLFETDINEIIFVRLLGILEKASQFKGTGYVPTGLCWNAGGIAPILFIGFFLEKKRIAKLSVVCAALLTQSATLTLGILLCILFDILNNKKLQRRIAFKKISNNAIIFFIFFVPLIVILILGNLDSLCRTAGRLWEVFSYRQGGIFSESSTMDSSTSAHLGYLINIPQLLMSSDLSNIVFGFGNNCSGFHYSRITGQYAGETWIVECDPTNIVLNNGIIGFAAYYYWMISGLVGLRGNKPLFLSILILLLMGFTYNLQYVWVVFFELLVFELEWKSVHNRMSGPFLIGDK